MELLHSGKIREVYADGDDILLVASDRVSVYDVVLPTLIPDKGKILTQLSLWWFDQLADLVPNHVISATDVPSEWAGRAIRCRRLRAWSKCATCRPRGQSASPRAPATAPTRRRCRSRCASCRQL